MKDVVIYDYTKTTKRSRKKKQRRKEKKIKRKECSMSEQQIDFKKIISAFKSKKFTPEQLGSLFRQYYVKHLKDNSFETFIKTPTKVSNETQELLKAYDGMLPLHDLDN